MQGALSRYWTERASSFVECLLEGVEESLALEIIEYVESILQQRARADHVLNRMLRAPLRVPSDALILSKRAIGGGFGALGALLERLHSLQPLLGRLTEHWLSLTPEAFADLDSSQQDLWNQLVNESIILELLEAPDSSAFRSSVNKLVFVQTSPSSRGAIAGVARALSDRVFPSRSAPQSSVAG